MKDKDRFTVPLQELFAEFAKGAKAHGVAGVCLVLAPVREVERGVIADVRIDCAGDPEVMTDQVTMMMLNLAYSKIMKGATAQDVAELKGPDA